MIIKAQELQEIIKSGLGKRLPPNMAAILPDPEYYLPSMDEVSDILLKSDVNLLEYREAVHDCDNFAYLLKSVFIMDAYKKNLKREHALGMVWGNFPTPHAINWVVTKDKRFYFIEPQSDLVYAPRKKDGSVFMIFA